MKKLFLFVATTLLFCACSSDDMIVTQNEKHASNQLNTKNVQLSVNQAKTYAKLFYKGFASSSEPKSGTRSIPQIEPSVGSVSYLIEGRDTLLYAINYANNKGYVLLSGVNNAFPILAHNDEGNLDFQHLSKESPLYAAIEKYKQKAKSELAKGTAAFNDYYNDWKDLGKEGYEYEVDLTNSTPQLEARTRSRRRESSGKETIYPHTGKALNTWKQEGGYNFYAEHKYPIGCPAIAIGMLMYDTTNRLDGIPKQTKPSFSIFDSRDITGETRGTALAKNLRQIADSIPNYTFSSEGSGAEVPSILIGLHKLGYTKAECKDYDFEELYRNLTFEGFNYFGNKQKYHRGVLLCSAGYPAGHIWFCDGYYEQGYTVKKKFLFVKLKTWHEYEDCLYMNWGWGENGGNGWYTADGYQWHSPETGNNNPYNIYTKMFVNLSTYELPHY